MFAQKAMAADNPFDEDLDIQPFLDEIKEELLSRQETAHTMAECARALGYDEDNPIIFLAKEEWHDCQKQIDNLDIWQDKYEEYPYATYVWLFLTTELQYSDEVAAGIMGNIMAECSGGTLDIQYWLYSSGSGFYYGMCQWSKTTYPDVRGQDLKYQCNFLAKTIEYEINVFGYAYQKGYKFENFLELTSPEDAALMFAKCYERCAQSTYQVRQKNAAAAYKYYVTSLREKELDLGEDEG